MAKLYNRFWVIIAIALSIVVAVLGFPVFQRKFGFPASLLWTFAVVLGVWVTYLIRAYMFSGPKPDQNGRDNET
jgi:hypothetical protein